eukprot:2936574-Prymnesium_polylepis.1
MSCVSDHAGLCRTTGVGSRSLTSLLGSVCRIVDGTPLHLAHARVVRARPVVPARPARAPQAA